jgi:ABC-2 type transport system permease protein
VKLWLALVRASIRSQMQYKVNFLLYSVGNFLAVGVEVIGIWALFARFGSLPGWSIHEIAVLYGMVHLAFAIAEAAGRGFDQFSSVIKSGDFDRYLLRPCPTALLIAGQIFELSRVGRVLAGLTALVWGLANAQTLGSPLALLVVVFAVLSGALIFYSVLVLQATLCFFTVESLEIVNAVTYGGIFAAQLPFTIYPNWMRLFFTYAVPLAFVNYIPARVLFGKPDASLTLALLSPIIGLAFLFFALTIWRLGERKYTSTGS